MAEGTPDFGCNWEVGDQTVSGTGTVCLGSFSLVAGQTVEEAMATHRGFANDPVDVEGLGDEAFFEHELTGPVEVDPSRSSRSW